MDVEKFMKQFDSGFFTGVPDSALRPICDYLMEHEGISKRHVIAANEGNCVGMAVGSYLATGEIPVVYLQNSGIGNIMNPVISLLHEEVYKIPCIFFVGWRGEPGGNDEPQHRYQGKVTLEMLKTAGITPFIIDKDTSEKQMQDMLEECQAVLEKKHPAAFVIKPGAVTQQKNKKYLNHHQLLREAAMETVLAYSGRDVVVSSTGKISRELFELREKNRQPHEQDFLTVGSMGHCSSIALGIAMEKKAARIWCFDGDGSVLMHMGALAVIGSLGIDNLVHVVYHNGAHESVGGMPTAVSGIDLSKIAEGCGYDAVYSVSDLPDLEMALKKIVTERKCTFLEIKVAIGSRADLGRPTTGTFENLKSFTNYLHNLS